ncbi:MAG: PAS domain-containing protein [Terracidiphilus sp.]|jgi:hypothetical protein
MQQEIGPTDGFSATGLELTTTQEQEMPRLVDAFDWASTPVGPAAEWPDSLKAVVRILLTSRFPMWMAWGPDLTILYNDAYRRTTLGKKHPWALGRPAAQVWHEIWKEIGPRIRRVMETGEASWEETLLLILERNGYPEETYHTFSYSPLSGPDGRIAGMLCVVSLRGHKGIRDSEVIRLENALPFPPSNATVVGQFTKLRPAENRIDISSFSPISPSN